MDAMDRETQKERISFKDLRSVKNDKNYDENGKRILKSYDDSSNIKKPNVVTSEDINNMQ